MDVLRGIAVLLVLLHHHALSGPLVEMGWLGVDLFFVLSGFLVSGLIFDEYRGTGKFRGGRFLLRRAFKIHPSFYVLIGVTALLMWLSGRSDPFVNYLAEILFFQNYHEGLWAHTWSLAVEEHFYLLLVATAVLIIACKRPWPWAGFLAACVTGVLLFIALRAYSWIDRPFVTLTHFYPSHLRMDSLLAGVVLAGWHRTRPQAFDRFFRIHPTILLLAAGILLLPVLLLPFGSFFMYTIGLTGAYLAAMVLVGLAVACDDLYVPSPPARVLAWVGGISYNTYLWHLLVLLTLETVGPHFGLKAGWVEFALFILGSVLMGWFATRTVERYGLNLRARFFP